MDDKDLADKSLAMSDGLKTHLQEMQKLSLEATPLCAHMTETLMPRTLDSQADWTRIIELGLTLGADFANRGMQLAHPIVVAQLVVVVATL